MLPLTLIHYNAVVNNSGRRFVVYGPPGSGKTTLAERIAQRLDIPHIELDAIFWLPEWQQRTREEFRAEVSAALNRCPDGWVCDGMYWTHAKDLILPFADTVVWCATPLPMAFWRLLKRTIARAIDGKLLWGTNRESWQQSFFSRDSIVLYQLTNWRKFRKRERELDGIPHQPVVIRLRTQKEVEAFLIQLGR